MSEIATTSADDLHSKDPEEIRFSILRTYAAGLKARGVPDPDISPNSEIYVLATAVANELAVSEANFLIGVNDVMPDTAKGARLDQWLAAFGLARRGEVAAIGFVVLAASHATDVNEGAQLSDRLGQTYEVTIGGSYAPGDPIPVQGVSTGSKTNQYPDTPLTWASAPAFSDPTAKVWSGGLTLGADVESDDSARTRLLSRLQTPPKGGNWQHVAEVAEASSPYVQKAFVYPAAEGPSTVHVAVVGAASAVSRFRDVVALEVENVVKPAVEGAFAEHAQFTFTTVTNVPVDIAIGLDLDLASGSGKWSDLSPWPVPPDTSPKRVAVTSVTSANQFTVDAPTAPAVGVSQIAWLNPSTWKVFRALVIGVTGSPGAYTITLDSPFAGITTGAFIMPQASNLATYVAAFLAGMGAMGPGEKTSNPTRLVRAYRHPIPGILCPSTISGHLLRRMTDAGAEVDDAGFLYRSAITPDVPASIASPPNQFVPRHFAVYPLP